jgi:hypothetical protein
MIVQQNSQQKLCDSITLYLFAVNLPSFAVPFPPLDGWSELGCLQNVVGENTDFCNDAEQKHISLYTTIVFHHG